MIWYGGEFSLVQKLGDSQRDSEQKCRFGLASASLAVKPERQELMGIRAGDKNTVRKLIQTAKDSVVADDRNCLRRKDK